MSNKFMLFVSDCEIDIDNSKVLKCFSNVNSLQDLLAKDLSLLPQSWSVVNKKADAKINTGQPYLAKCDATLADLKQNKAIEFDLKYVK